MTTKSLQRHVRLDQPAIPLNLSLFRTERVSNPNVLVLGAKRLLTSDGRPSSVLD